MTRVLHYITRLGLGGAEAMALSLVRALQRDFEFGVYAIRGIEDSDIGRTMQADLASLGVPVFCGTNWPLKLGGMAIAGARAAQITRRFAPDFAHLHTEIPESAYATMIALRPGRATQPVVRTIHNSVYWHFWPRLGRWCERHMRPSHVAAVSHDALRAFTEHRQSAGAGPLPRSPIVIYNGVPTPPARSVLRPPDAPLRVLFAGRFDPEKGADLVPAIIAQVPAPPNAELVIHGHGRHAPTLQALAAHPPAGWKISVHPPLANLRERFGEFDLVLVPSRFEGLALIALEVQMAGTPLVVTNALGVREAVAPDHPWVGRAGDPADIAAAVRRALADRARWPEMVEAAHAFACRRFSLATMADAYHELYRGVALR